VMMTAVSFIIGVLPIILGPGGGGHTPPHNRTTRLTRLQVGPLVGKQFKPAPFLLLHPLPDWGQRHNAVY
ncbi:hypothetical protein, partial [Enterobacter asburiae]